MKAAGPATAPSPDAPSYSESKADCRETLHLRTFADAVILCLSPRHSTAGNLKECIALGLFCASRSWRHC